MVPDHEDQSIFFQVFLDNLLKVSENLGIMLFIPDTFHDELCIIVKLLF